MSENTETQSTEVFPTESQSCQLPKVAPRQRVQETPNGWRIEVELPGVAPEDLKLEVVQRVLQLEGSPAASSPPEGAKALRREYRRTAFVQSWRLPARIDLDSIETQYRHGLLTIELPSSAPERRTIDVQVS